MRRDTYCASLLLIGLVLSCASAATVASSSSMVQPTLVNQYPDPARAGDTVEVRLNFQNAGGDQTGEIWVEAQPDYPFTLLSGDSVRQVISSLPSYPAEASSKVLEFRFRVDSNAKDGEYALKFRHSLDQGTTWTSYDYTIKVTAVQFVGITSITPTHLMPGKVTQMTINITNEGNAPLQNMIFSWNEKNDAILPVGSDNTQYIKYLGVGQTVQLTYDVITGVSTTPGLYKLSLTLQYDLIDSTGNVSKSSTSTEAGIYIGGETDFDVTFSESSQGTISLSVANIGDNRALSVTVKVPRQNNFDVSGSSSAIVGNLDTGDYTTVSFQIVPHSNFTRGGASSTLTPEERQALRQQAPANNTLDVVIEYTDTTGTRQSVQKEVPIVFSASTTGTTTGTQATRSNGSLWTNPFVIGGAIVLVLAVGGFLYMRRGKKPQTNNPTEKKLMK